MSRWAVITVLAALAAGAVNAATETNYTDAVEIKGRKYWYVYGFADGTLFDPSGKIASQAHAVGVKAAIGELEAVVEEARASAAENLKRMYAVTNLLETFTRKIFVQATLYPDMNELVNCWGRVVTEWTDGTNDTCMVYFSREFKVPPVMKRRYITELGTNTVEGVWTDFESDGQLVDGYEGCKEIRFKRPDGVIGKNCFSRQYLKFGSRETGFDFGTRVFTIDDEIYYTGSWTNVLGEVLRFNNGINTTEVQDVK